MTQSAAGPSFFERGLVALPLFIPGLAGLVYFALFNAPQNIVLINASALAAGALWAIVGWRPKATSARVRGGTLVLIALLALPLLVGSEVQGITRWLALGGFTLNVGLTFIPLLVVLSALNERWGPYVLLTAILVVTFQPDAASALALTGAAFCLALANRDWRTATVVALGAVATVVASLAPNLPPQPFVERVIPSVWNASPILSMALCLSLIASLALILRTPSAPRAPRFALAGAMAGFVAAAFWGDYPTPLIGYGAASIIGLTLALPAIRQKGTGE